MYKAVSSAYGVTYGIIEKLEQEYLNGTLDASGQSVLSGCYSVIDYLAHLIANLGVEEEGEEIPADPDQLKAAADFMSKLAVTLEDNLYDDNCPGAVDYRKVHALVGLRAVSKYIDAMN